MAERETLALYAYHAPTTIGSSINCYVTVYVKKCARRLVR